jgi:hypothetical protein
MPKISQISSNPLIPSTPKSKSTTGSQFQQNLEITLKKNQSLTPSNTVASSLGEVSPVAFKIAERSSPEILNQTHTLLDLLDAYAKDMENPHKTLKEIEPLMLEIKRHSAELTNYAGDDPDLNNIVTRCALAANVECIKFQRGDYNN